MQSDYQSITVNLKHLIKHEDLHTYYHGNKTSVMPEQHHPYLDFFKLIPISSQIFSLRSTQSETKHSWRTCAELIQINYMIRHLQSFSSKPSLSIMDLSKSIILLYSSARPWLWKYHHNQLHIMMNFLLTSAHVTFLPLHVLTSWLELINGLVIASNSMIRLIEYHFSNFSCNSLSYSLVFKSQTPQTQAGSRIRLRSLMSRS